MSCQWEPNRPSTSKTLAKHPYPAFTYPNSYPRRWPDAHGRHGRRLAIKAIPRALAPLPPPAATSGKTNHPQAEEKQKGSGEGGGERWRKRSAARGRRRRIQHPRPRHCRGPDRHCTTSRHHCTESPCPTTRHRHHGEPLFFLLCSPPCFLHEHHRCVRHCTPGREGCKVAPFFAAYTTHAPMRTRTSPFGVVPSRQSLQRGHKHRT
jgi:hypothetical protein